MANNLFGHNSATVKGDIYRRCRADGSTKVCAVCNAEYDADGVELVRPAYERESENG